MDRELEFVLCLFIRAGVVSQRLEVAFFCDVFLACARLRADHSRCATCPTPSARPPTRKVRLSTKTSGRRALYRRDGCTLVAALEVDKEIRVDDGDRQRANAQGWDRY